MANCWSIALISGESRQVDVGEFEWHPLDTLNPLDTETHITLYIHLTYPKQC